MQTIKLIKKQHKLSVKHVSRSIQMKHIGTPGVKGDKGDVGATGAGMPTGGLTDQILQKVSDAEYDFKWMNPTYADKTYSQEFTVSKTIIVPHNLKKYPAVTVVDSAGDEVEGDVHYTNNMSLTVNFAAPFSGRVTCN